MKVNILKSRCLQKKERIKTRTGSLLFISITLEKLGTSCPQETVFKDRNLSVFHSLSLGTNPGAFNRLLDIYNICSGTKNQESEEI